MSSAASRRPPLSQIATLGVCFVIGVGTPKVTRADCDLAACGISTDVVAPIDVAHVRNSLADVGFTVGGFYLGETFANTGGIRHGATYDDVVWTYLNGDLHKAGFCSYADAYQILRASLRTNAPTREPPIALTFNSGRPINGDWSTSFWRAPDSRDPKGISLFGRVIGADGPEPRRFLCPWGHYLQRDDPAVPTTLSASASPTLASRVRLMVRCRFGSAGRAHL
jgi:hypothetical protein